MLRTLADTFYGKGSAAKWFKSEYSDEEIVFASAATILETTESAPIGWSFQRLFQHRGVVIITKHQIAFKNSVFSFSAILYIFLFIFALFMLIANQDWDYLLGVIVFGLYTVQFLPYQKQIPLKDIQRVNLGSVRGILTNGSLLTIYLKGKMINIVPAQILSEDIKHIISLSKN